MEFGVRPDPRRRLMGIGAVVVLHALLIYGLFVGLARKEIDILPQPIETKIVEEIQTQEVEPPPPPPPTIDIPPASFVPPPEIVIRTPPPPSNAIQAVTSNPTPPPVAYTPPVRTAAVINAKRNCPEPEYPALSLRLGEKGTVKLGFLIGVDGRVKESRIDASSGHPRLDEAARRALSRCRFTPGTVDGKVEESWAQLLYTWKIPG
jgi:protein TonB